MVQKKNKKKQTRKPPSDANRCIAKTSSGHRCRKKKRNDDGYCEMHSPDLMKEARAKGLAVINREKKERKKLALEAAARWNLHTFSDIITDTILDLEYLEADKKIMSPNHWWHNWWRGKSILLESLKAKIQSEGGGGPIVLVHRVTSDGLPDFTIPKTPKPIPKQSEPK